MNVEVPARAGRAPVSLSVKGRGRSFGVSEAEEGIHGGMSGSPIILPARQAVGVVCIAKGSAGAAAKADPTHCSRLTFPAGWSMACSRSLQLGIEVGQSTVGEGWARAGADLPAQPFGRHRRDGLPDRADRRLSAAAGVSRADLPGMVMVRSGRVGDGRCAAWGWVWQHAKDADSYSGGGGGQFHCSPGERWDSGFQSSGITFCFYSVFCHLYKSTPMPTPGWARC